ncbi:MAG: hypothetical protein CBC12_06090 [Candidatus Puniceispirillum sp. TMED52]|nr:hypothetical protein [SAR116 cluster bacterium]OUU50094.1 MAG: hypothetical protein CBC12_06090 [Candidatus Puniceispirillum sp. TMED52]
MLHKQNSEKVAADIQKTAEIIKLAIYVATIFYTMLRRVCKLRFIAPPLQQLNIDLMATPMFQALMKSAF